VLTWCVLIGNQAQGIFRVPGSCKVVNALYDYYCCVHQDKDDISGTVRCANLPLHIKASVSDVASTFKRLLGALPGGILGSLTLFDALVAIHSQLRGDPELNRTRQSKIRGRLIALAIGTVRSQFQRELICAVFGLLSLMGRAAEVAPREDGQGRPLPTAGRMGYGALGVVFGPLLVGDLLEGYGMRLASPHAGLLLFPTTPPRTTRQLRRVAAEVELTSGPLTVDKIHVANDIAEMLITHWREVVKHLRQLDALKPSSSREVDEALPALPKRGLRPSASENFIFARARGWDHRASSGALSELAESPLPETPTPSYRK